MKFLIGAAAAACAIASAAPVAAATLVNGGFEDGPALNYGTYYRGPAAPDGWSRVAGYEAPDILDNAYTQTGAGLAQLLGAHGGSRYLDMNGASPSGGIYQDITGLTVGSVVTITYWVSQWAQNSAGTLTASLIGTDATAQVVDVPYSPGAQSAAWTQYSLSGVAQSDTVRIQFIGYSGSTSRGAPGLDDVALNVVSGAPEPAAWALMIAGFGLSGAALRRRQTRLA
ncbi:MAG: PEP-CTERM sorting domain-containing protein [Phenylobacterium sp.]|uniref:PEPxxWA-CTERM sorting domain-containing protein n=1 Tax=Phenylobacterium sp. TaxID=1871053 RepID=UPI0025D8292D|nr:PEPxxWA-CTERM sorting domain-containing protein [Phenylobacterium sp.]MBI1198241.1 PEP-CTERM sorting domain-containing protein [Phenylobacterium sp.]